MARLVDVSEGNFMYLTFVLADIAALVPSSTAIDRLPKGLPAYYAQFWRRTKDTQSEEWSDWDTLYRPTIERLAVAAEAVTPDCWPDRSVGRGTRSGTGPSSAGNDC